MTDPPQHPVLVINPLSGGGKAQRHDLVGACRARGIQPVVADRGADMARLAASAVERGADAIGMAGGDGSQAAVAGVAALHDVPFVCVPAGTRNHLALDLGVDRRDVLGALDAFSEGLERRVDLARVNGRFFVNNASMGMYGAIVQSPDYRNAKLRTVISMLPELVGPGVGLFDLRFRGPDGTPCAGVQLLLVSNNPYEIDPVGGGGTRGLMNQGTLGVVSARLDPPPPVKREWTTTRFVVESGAPVNLGLDGEAVSMGPPLEFECVPSALRVRVRRPRGASAPRPPGRRTR